MGLSEIAPPSASTRGVHSRRRRCSEERPPRGSPRGPCGGAASPSARRCHSPGSFRPCRSSRLRRLAPPRAFQVCCTLEPIMGFATFQVRRASCGPRPAGLGLSPSSDRTAVRATLAGAPPAAPPRPLCPRAEGERRGDQSRTGFRRTIPCGASPFGAFPSPTAAPRQPPPPSRTPCAPSGSGDPSLLVRPERVSVPWSRATATLAFPPLFPVRALPARACWPFPFTRPQGLGPSASPLRHPGVSAGRRPMLPWASPLEGLLSRDGCRASSRSPRAVRAASCAEAPVPGSARPAGARRGPRPGRVRASPACHLQRTPARHGRAGSGDPTSASSRRSVVPGGSTRSTTSGGISIVASTW
jgi:hypothetical protein